jgi:hypothetical protein
MIHLTMRRMLSNRLFLAALAGTLVWFADQPTVVGYNPLLEMFWDPGIYRLPPWDYMVLAFSWLLTTIFFHFVLFTWQKMRARNRYADR